MEHLSTVQLIRNSAFKLMFELIGTAFLTLAFNGSLYRPAGRIADAMVYIPNFPMNQTTILLTLWVLTIFGIKISGAHYNPAISFAFMLRKDVGHFPRPLALAYILAQCLGGFGGALVSWFLRVDPSQAGGVRVVDDSGANVFAAMVAEGMGSFLVVFFYLHQTEAKTVFSKEKAINCFIIASAYVGARAMLHGTTHTYSGAVLNPAIAIGTNIC